MNLYEYEWINIDGNYVHKTALIHPDVVMGKGNYIGAYTVIGGNGEIRGTNQRNYKGKIYIGNNNVISEHVTIQRPYEETATEIGDNNIIMAHSHIGHDAKIGSWTEICTSTVVGGYATINDKAKIKLGVIIRNRVTIGVGAIVGMGSVVTKDVEELTTVVGVPAKKI